MIHFGSAIAMISTAGGAATFLYGCYRQIRKAASAIVEGKNAVVAMVNEHHEMYGWFATEIKPKRKPNGAALGGIH